MKALITHLFGVRMAWIRQDDGTYAVEQRNEFTGELLRETTNTRKQLRVLIEMGVSAGRGPIVPSSARI